MNVNQESSIILNSKGNVAKVHGWKSLFVSSKEDNGKVKGSILPIMAEDESCNVDVSIKKGKTKPPKPYKAGNLINMMINAGKEVENKEDKAVLKKWKVLVRKQLVLIL